MHPARKQQDMNRKTYRFLFLVCTSLLVLSCVKEDMLMQKTMQSHSSSVPYAGGESGLVCNENGEWVAQNCRVPLVGAGRIIDDLYGNLVSVSGRNVGMNNIVDLDLDRYADFSSLGVTVLGNELFTVKDMYRTYAKDQDAGFVIGTDDSKGLSLEVLSLFVITAYKDNSPVGVYHVGSGDSESLLDLEIVKVSTDAKTGRQALSVKVDAPFDEIALSTTGVSANLASMKVYYAFVGNDPVEYIYSDGSLGSPSIREDVPFVDTGWTNVMDTYPQGILDSDDDGVNLYTDPLTSLLAVRNLTVDFGSMQIDKGTEIGFTYSQGSALTIDALTTMSLIPYDDNWDEIEQDKYSSTGLLGLTVMEGGTGAYSLVTSTDGTKALKIHFGGVRIDAGVFKLLRVFKRDPVKIDPSSYFTAAPEVVTSRSSYRFMTPLTDDSGMPYGTLELAITDRGGETADENHPEPARIDGNSIVGMHPDVTYTVAATFRMNDGSGRSFTMTTKITCEAEPSADIHFMTGDGYRLASGSRNNGLINLIPNLENGQNLITESLEDAAVYSKVLSLIDYSVIAAVETADGSPIVPDGEVRVGFAIQPTRDILNLSALDFFRIVLYNGSEKVDTYVPAENQSVSLGLLSGSNGKIAVTALTDKPFDRVELQTAGVLTLQLSSMSLYYAFYEKTNGNHNSDSGIGDLGVELMTYASHGLRVNYDQTGFSGIKVGTMMTRFENMLDSGKETDAKVEQLVDLLGSMSIAATFEPVETSQWIGVMVNTPSGLLDASILSDMDFEIYNDGNLVETISQQAGLLGLQLLGYGDCSYIEAYPTAGNEFDEVRLVKRSLADVTENILVYGVYMRADANHNGIPDDSEDGSGDQDNEESMAANPSVYHLCAPSDLTVKVTGGMKGNAYDLIFTSENGTGEEYPYPGMVLGDDRTFVVSSASMAEAGMGTGIYLLSIVPAGQDPAAVTGNYPEGVEIYIHPSRTEWQGGDASSSSWDVTDWNEWGNWSDGAPWTCTDVLISGGCPSYPVLKTRDAEGAYVTNVCNNIQFGDGGEVVYPQYLTYGRAWVNFSLARGRYSMFSSPLKETYTGDMFVSMYDGDYLVEAGPDYAHSWLTYDESTYPSMDGARFTPKVYQRVWNRAVENVTVSGSEEVDFDDGMWSAPFNRVDDLYEAGKGVLIRPGTEGEAGDGCVFCLPKAHAEYCYYDLETGRQYDDLKASVPRTNSYSGRFIYEDASGAASFPMHVLLENERPSDTYLAGNPFMCHLSVAKFKEFNPAVKSVMVYEYSESTGKYEYREIDSSGQIAPMQGFLVKVGGIYAETSRFRLNIHFMPDMMETGR